MHEANDPNDPLLLCEAIKIFEQYKGLLMKKPEEMDE